MRLFVFPVILFFTFIFSALAGFQQIEIRDLNFHYIFPLGEGELEKLNIGMSLISAPSPVRIERTDNSFVVSSSLVDFEWIEPFPFVHNIQELKVSKLHARLGKGGHGASADFLSVTPDAVGEFSMGDLKVFCQGTSAHPDLEDRIVLDCFEKMKLEIGKLDLPFDFFSPLLTNIEYQADSTEEIPLGDFSFLNEEGKFQAALKVKFLISAYVRAFGFVKYDAPTSTVAIRIDKIKYGILPITDLVMKELQRRVQNPKVTIDPPWIYIKTKNLK